ncbi:MAG: carbamoyl phosphate synthase large subunit, partial [Myxococcales bacterium]|nr:carbamoyl phosphate synthase large subunit [Myxococcales bacterium]
VKEAVFPFAKFPGVDTQLGPEMRSTGEVMGIADSFGEAYGKSQIAANVRLPEKGGALITVKDSDKRLAKEVARRLLALGFEIMATRGTAAYLNAAGIKTTPLNKVSDGSPHVVDRIKDGTVSLIINTTVGAKSIRDSYSLRRQALLSNVPLVTTVPGGLAFAEALEAKMADAPRVKSLQEWSLRTGA